MSEFGEGEPVDGVAAAPLGAPVVPGGRLRRGVAGELLGGGEAVGTRRVAAGRSCLQQTQLTIIDGARFQSFPESRLHFLRTQFED